MLDTFSNILDIVTTCESLGSGFVKNGQIENAPDYVMDVQVLKMSHDLMGTTTDKMGNSDFSEDELIAALTNVLEMESGEYNFDPIADIAAKCCRTSQFCVSMLGTFEYSAAMRPDKPQKERQKAKKGSAVKAPENIRELTKSDKGAAKINIVRLEIQRVCRERNTDCLPYYELICHPQDFMASIDVSFQISFLVRDGFLGLKKINDEPHVFLYDPDPTQQSQRVTSSDTVQSVMSFTAVIWKEKVKKFQIRSPLLKFDMNQSQAGEEMETDSD